MTFKHHADTGRPKGTYEEEGLDPVRSPHELLRKATYRFRIAQLGKLLASRSEAASKLKEVPERMQRLTNQVRLLFELFDDVWTGRYRKVRWHALAVAVAAALYFVHPADLIPDALPILGQLDDVLMLALAIRVLRRELQEYLVWREMDPADYF